jgi:DNA-binding transcriptional ArsR family regulator
VQIAEVVETEALDDVETRLRSFGLGDGDGAVQLTRRSILQLVSAGPASISELARPFGIALPTVLEHVRILEETQLLTTEKVGRVRECTLGPERLDEARQWIETFRMWERRLDALDRYVSTRSGRRG